MTGGCLTKAAPAGGCTPDRGLDPTTRDHREQDPCHSIHHYPPSQSEITASTAGTLVIRHRITTDASGGPDLLCLAWEVHPADAPAVLDGSTPVGDVDALVEVDGPTLSCSLLGLERPDLVALIDYLTGVRDEWQAAA